MLAGFTHRPVVELSERLAALAPADLGHAFYGSDGASAIEIALKMSFHYWQQSRPRRTSARFVSLAGSYHGETLGALAVTDVPLFRDTYAPLLDAQRASCRRPDCAARGRRRSRARRRRARGRALEAHLAQHHATTAALIVEPLVQGATGMAMYDAALPAPRARALHALRRPPDRRRDHDRLRPHRDAVRVRAGRASRPTSCCLSKGITGGYLPLSCVLSTDAIYAAFYDDDVARGFLHSHSTRATRSRAARRWPCSTSSATTT